ncbi:MULTISPECIES: ATP-binding cassette domain-containing protein [unclassified Microbacterium]|uniref:ABC transporter ATP-binding protein n=1 Tax=unclassified Microbacterium TaxID=2609290 RepID=UPI00214AE6B3|nr:MULTISPECIES: ATP-binding cassette domain-containing protein [unclassified Microbacterium]MCR2810272.1 ATP-binding cassette domain-containing protein [Microbacterium sp. zg.B185]WIM19899.1 ATP-binding cassette domain-containing protein [Microbacterium sp. zg-B185]
MKRVWAVLQDLLPLLPLGAQRYFVFYMIATTLVTLLDVVAMSLLAIVIGPAITGGTLDLPIVGEITPEMAPLLALSALVLIIVKSICSVSLHWHATRRFAKYELEIGDRMFRAYINSSWEQRSKRSVAEITRIADAGIANTMAGFLLPLMRVPSSMFTFVLVLAVLLVVNPMISIIALVYLTLIALIVHQFVTKRALEAAQVNLEYSYRVAILMTEMMEALKELSLRNRLSDVAELVTTNRQRSVRARANGSILGIIPGFVFEIALIGGIILVGGASFFQGGLTAALTSVALFATAGFRLIPAINGIQGGIVQAVASIPSATDVIGDLIASENDMKTSTTPADTAELADKPREMRLENVRFRYPKASEDVIRGMSVDIPLGSSLGIVGPSGAGKSTLIDLLLGLSVPSSGEIRIDGHPLNSVLRQWRGRVGYVPQRVALFDGTIAQNVALTWNDEIDRERVVRALERAQLGSLVASRAGGIDERIGERGVSLSGGQQQRLGIARALYTDPLVLVLDEATSSLDTKTEDEVTKSIKALQGEVTLISVAHRLSTIKDYDRVCYVDEGVIVSQGTFYEVAASLPSFAEQVLLAGLARDRDH